MTKKAFAVAALGVALALGAASGASAEAFDGVHIGVGIGSNKLSVDERVPGTQVTVDKSKRQTTPELFVGLDKKVTDKFVLGAELNAGFKDREVNVRTGTVNYKAEVGKTLDLTARAGFLATDNLLLYGRAGVSRYEVKREALDGTNRVLNVKKTETRPVYGVGAEYAFNDNISLRGEYLRRNGKSNVKTDDVKIAIAYKF